MPFLPLLLVLADPMPGPLKSFGDWAVACDNQHRCEMTSLIPEDGDNVPADGQGYEDFSFSIVRDPGPAGALTIVVEPYGEVTGKVSLRIDGKVLASGTLLASKDLRISGAPAAAIVAAMVQGRDMTINDAKGDRIGRASLAGSSAAMRFIDADQGRAGTVTALVARGTKPASSVPAAMTGPVVRYVRPAGTPMKITPALRKAMDGATGCDDNYEGGEGDPPAVDAFAIGGGKTLALLPCGSGAYNYSSVPFILAPGAKPVIAGFDFPPGLTSSEDGEPTLVNASFDAKTATLSSYSKGRGIGDCGAAEDYVWDGTKFRLIAARAMGECRGSINWLTIYRAGALAK
ncbi:DUF1176 domain-containing protein [Sphingomonas sp. LB-2]|uniref:DUF1176 domain-containing protein n=1 Tax=Sphingomonas caeni TaxID=2984949 RepID=UPI00222F6C7E|nr:DUF1176 domain-containing protein [Sphingomonas caeni]MCW3846358.1 DUF1176 domain-containing protein [Sphingomonas caeni]